MHRIWNLFLIFPNSKELGAYEKKSFILLRTYEAMTNKKSENKHGCLKQAYGNALYRQRINY